MLSNNDVSKMSDAAVFVQTNEPTNRVIAFGRAVTGALEEVGDFATGGAGNGVAHLPSQGSVVLTEDGEHLLVTNVASDDVSLFAVRDGGIELMQVIGSGGDAPRSVTEHDGLVYVLNTGTPSLVGFRLADGALELLADSVRELAMGSDPAQVGFSPNGSRIVVTERGTDAIVTRGVRADGTLDDAVARPSLGPTPYGFAFAGKSTLVVTEAFGAMKGKAAASSYVLQNGSVAPVSASVGNGRSEICWAVVSKDDRFAFTTNFADGAVSRYAIGSDGTLVLEDAVAGSAIDGATGLRDEGLSGDGRFLYAIDADSRSIFGWEVGSDGSLTPVGSWNGLPATVAGLAAS